MTMSTAATACTAPLRKISSAHVFVGRMATFDGGLLWSPRHDDEGAPGTVHEQEVDEQQVSAPLSLS